MIEINAKAHTSALPDSCTLLQCLREEIGLLGPKLGCGEGECGACTVLIDGQREHACVFDASSAVGKKIVTVEGLSTDNSHPVQKAWIDNQVPQCGYCQPGMIMACEAGRRACGCPGCEACFESGCGLAVPDRRASVIPAPLLVEARFGMRRAGREGKKAQGQCKNGSGLVKRAENPGHDASDAMIACL